MSLKLVGSLLTNLGYSMVEFLHRAIDIGVILFYCTGIHLRSTEIKSSPTVVVPQWAHPTLVGGCPGTGGVTKPGESIHL